MYIYIGYNVDTLCIYKIKVGVLAASGRESQQHTRLA